MIIVTEKKRNTLSENTEQILIQDFVKLVGRKTLCYGTWKSKSGYTEIAADPPAFCGFFNGYFYIAVKDGLSVNFPAKSIFKIIKEDYGDGTPADYALQIRDGTVIRLNLL
jgi:hypothetical protein